MVIYSNGCSHTAGHFIKFINTWPNVFIKGIIGDTDYQLIDSISYEINNCNYWLFYAFGDGPNAIHHILMKLF